MTDYGRSYSKTTFDVMVISAIYIIYIYIYIYIYILSRAQVLTTDDTQDPVNARQGQRPSPHVLSSVRVVVTRLDPSTTWRLLDATHDKKREVMRQTPAEPECVYSYWCQRQGNQRQVGVTTRRRPLITTAVIELRWAK